MTIEYDDEVNVVDARPSRVGEGLVDIVSVAEARGRPRQGDEPVWVLWRSGPPVLSGSWIAYEPRQRGVWLNFAAARAETGHRDPAAGLR